MKSETIIVPRKITGYNEARELDVHFMELSINLDEIKTDGYELGISQCPITRSSIDEIKENFTSISQKPIVAFSCHDGLYHVVTKQELVEAVKELNDEGKIEIKDIVCDILFRKTGIIDVKLPEDIVFCFQFGRSKSDGTI